MPPRLVIVAFAASLALGVIPSAVARQQAESPSDLRTGFVAERPVSTTTTPKPPRSRRRAKTPTKQANLGVGYTVFEHRTDGATVRADPRRVFASGDKIRLLIEPGGTGFLYIFHVEGDEGAPSMLFPSARLSGGDNAVFAHQPIEVPSRFEPDTRNQWFVFDARPGTEHLYFVVSRTRLAGVPTGKALRAWSSRNRGAAAWRPSPADWKRIVGAKAAAPAESFEALFGATESDFERDAVTRGLGLQGDAPAPTVISMSDRVSARTFVTRVSLAHQ